MSGMDHARQDFYAAVAFGDAVRALLPSFTDLAAGLVACEQAMGSLGRRLDAVMHADIAALNDTQRAIYFAHRRAGRCHYDILVMMQ